jgi:hypothetical protein
MPAAMTESPSPRFPAWLGLAQGIALYALYKIRNDNLWPQEWGWLFNALLLGALLLPFVAYWGHGVLTRAALRCVLLVAGLLVLGLGAYQGAMAFPQPEAARLLLAPASAFLGLALLVFMLVPLVSGWARGTADATFGGWQYPRLFEHAWRNAVVSVQAGVLTGLLWIVLSLGAQLFHLIGVDWPQQTLGEAWFAIPVTTLSIAFGLRSGLRRADFTVTLRNHWLTLTVWLLPLASFIGVAFVLTSLAGVDTLFERGLSAFFLLWFAAFWVKFFNSAFQNGQVEPALNPFLCRVLPFTSPALLAVAGLAAWALLLRIGQHGLTPDRLWGTLVATVALTYGAGYSGTLLAGKNARWMHSIARANIVAALVMCVGIVLLLSPLCDVNRFATASQMARLQSGQVTAEAFDVWALARQGRAGRDALEKLKARRGADGKPDKLAIRAEDAVRNADRYRSSEVNERDEQVAVLTERIEHYPAAKPFPAGFADFLKQDVATWDAWKRKQSCFARLQTQQHCAALLIDLDHDGQDEVVLWQGDIDQSDVYALSGKQWRRVGHLAFGEAGAPDSVRAELATGAYAIQPNRWDALRVGKTRYQVFEKAE